MQGDTPKKESIAFAIILVAMIFVIYIMAVGLNETFYGRWRSNRCVCTNVICKCPVGTEQWHY
jgi:hypothetical protein